MSEVHARARTTPLIRAEIAASQESVAGLSRRHNVTRPTIRKWRNRGELDVQDRSHRPHKLSTTLSAGEEAIVVELRRTLLLPLDDLLVVTREFINAKATRSGIARTLKRHDVGNLNQLIAALNPQEPKPVKTFKDYEPGFIHIDIKYLPQMPDESSRSYLFVAIDRATRWVFVRIYADQTEASSIDFLAQLHKASPMHIKTILTDNGTQFTDRFTSKKREPSGQHVFDERCVKLGIEHRLSPPRHPQTNGMVERFNGRIAEVLAQTRFSSAAELQATLYDYARTYNQHIPQRALKHQTPTQALKTWHAKKASLFTKRVYNLPGLDM